MSHQDGSMSSSEDTAANGLRLEKVNDNSASDVDDSAADVAFSDKDVDNSSDDYHKKRDKKSYKQSKSKVKIKTLTIDGQLVYFCKICDKVFTRRKDKLNHELAHSGESVLACTECGKEYLHESSLASHMRTHAGDPLFMCDLCPKMFAQSHHLKTHILSHSEPTNFVCKTCYKEFPTASDLNHHIRVQSKLEITNYWCKMCKVYFCRTHKLTCETRLHAFCCSACNELFPTQRKLKIHMKKFAHYSLDKPKYIEPLQEHELYPDKVLENLKKMQSQKENDVTQKPVKNDVNGKRHSDMSSDVPLKKFKLSVRKLIIDGDQSSTSVQDSATEAAKEVEMELKSPTRHRKGKPYCKKCNKSFKDSVDLDRHKALVHEDKQDSFKCEICSMGFASKDDLDKHSFKHTGERMHTCPVCGQEFPDSSQLTQHLRIHVNDFPYKCTQCGKAFRVKIQLIQHVRLHIAQDVNSEDKCTGSAGVANELQDHSHGEVESFKCHLCSKSFYFRYKLLNHLKLHANVKCFQCYICQKMFATKCNLQRHLQTHVKQGMDVDVHNIIIDSDSKAELDSQRQQVLRDNCQETENIQNHLAIDGVKKGDLNRPLSDIKRSISNFELENIVKDKGSMDSNINEVQGHSLDIRRGDIKVELQDDMDSFSEHSFSSSFTRDSERSDPFKFSSDESYSFKTVMAKERRRLRRRWRKNRELFIQSSLQDLSELKKKDLNSDTVCAEAGVNHEDDVTDMMVELNAVTSEFDDITTVFVNLTEKKMINYEKTILSCVKEISLVNDSSSLPKIELNVKKEIDQDYENNELEAPENNLKDIIKTHENADQAKSGGKMLLFEFYAERLPDGHIICNKERTDVSLDKHTDEICEIREEVKANTSNAEQVQRAESTLSSSQSLQPSSQKLPLKFIVADANLTSESSNLEKLQAVFEHSSKYLPLPYTSSRRKISPPVYHNETEMSTKDVSALNMLMHSQSMNSCNSLSQEKQQTFITQDSYNERVTMLPLHISQDNTLSDKIPQQVTAQDMTSTYDLKTESLLSAKIPEESFNSSLATSETSRNEFSRKNLAKRIPKESSNRYNHQNGRKCTTDIQHCSNTNNHNSTLMTSQPFNVANITSSRPQSSSFSISSATAHSDYNIFNLTSQPADHTSSVTSQPAGHTNSNVTSQPAGHTNSVTSQPAGHDSSNFSSHTSTHNSADFLAEPQSPASSSHMVTSPGQASSSFMMQPSYHGSSNLTVQASDYNSSNLLAHSDLAGSSLLAQPSSHNISMLISQSAGHAGSTPVVQPVHTSSMPMLQQGHAISTPMVQSVYTSSTPSVQSVHASSTPSVQSVYASSTHMVQSGQACSIPMTQSYSTPMIQHSSTPMVQHSSTPMVQHSSTPMIQHSSTPMVQHSSTPMVQHSSTHMVQQSSTNMVRHSSTPMVQQSSTNMVRHSATPMIQHSSTPMVQHSSTSMIQHSSTPMIQHSSTPMVQQSSTPMVQHSSTPMVQQSSTNMVRHSSTPMVQQSSTNMVRHSATPMIQHSSTPMVQHSSTPMVQHSSTPMIQHSSTPMVQSGHTSFLPMQQLGLFTKPLHDTNSNLSEQSSIHSAVRSSSSLKLNSHAHTSNRRTTTTSQNLTHKTSSLIAQQTNHSNSSQYAPPIASLPNPLYCNSVIGSSNSDVGYFQPGLNLSSSSVLSMNLNPVFSSVSTLSDNVTVNSGFVANQTNQSNLLGSCFISANPLMNQPCAIGLNTPVNPSFSLAVNPDFTLNPSTIFDASNPVYRDMNMMDLISTSSADFPQSVAAANVGFFSQGGLEPQMRQDIAPPLGLQGGILQSQNPLLNIGNPALGTSFEISGNQINNVLPHRIIPVGFGQLDNQFLTGPVGVGGGDGSLFNTGNIYSTLPRDIRLSNSNAQHFSMQFGQTGGSVPLDIANILPLNTGAFNDMTPLRTANIRGPLSLNIADFGGSSLLSTGNMPLNQASFSSDFPLSISTNPHMINHLSSMGNFPNSGFPGNLGNIIAPSGINFVNPAMFPQNTGLLPGSSTGFINDFTAGFFPKF